MLFSYDIGYLLFAFYIGFRLISTSIHMLILFRISRSTHLVITHLTNAFTLHQRCIIIRYIIDMAEVYTFLTDALHGCKNVIFMGDI